MARLGETLGIAPGETTADSRFTLLPVVCLGACDQAPAIMIDRTLHGSVEIEGLPAILGLYP
jgi:NADH-quinone oxidoreductase subunit E